MVASSRACNNAVRSQSSLPSAYAPVTMPGANTANELTMTPGVGSPSSAARLHT